MTWPTLDSDRIPEGLFVDREGLEVVIRDAQEVPWVTLHLGSEEDPPAWRETIEGLVIAALQAQEIHP